MHENSAYDIIIIGAGIQGAGVAQAAAACGYKTLVIEKFPEAGMGTSSKSSKLIHGGLRYLETGQFKLVHECLTERKLLLENAPGLVKLLPFYIPVYSHNSRPSWLVFIGLLIYSALSFKPFKIINKNQWKKLDGLNRKGLSQVFKYYDAQTDDTSLTQAVINSAQSLGAEVTYNSEFKSSQLQNNRHHVSFTVNDQAKSVTSQFLINCSGPWASLVQEKIAPTLKLPPIDLIAGTHIVINKKLSTSAYYLEASDRRAVFVLPWKEHYTLIGTTERAFSGSPDTIGPTENEISYLLQTYNQHFKQNLKKDDIESVFAGLRVLPGSTESTFKKSRESLLISSPDTPGLITLVGGKLTSYRPTAEKIISLVKKTLPAKKTSKESDTKKISLL